MSVPWCYAWSRCHDFVILEVMMLYMKSVPWCYAWSQCHVPVILEVIAMMSLYLKSLPWSGHIFVRHVYVERFLTFCLFDRWVQRQSWPLFMYRTWKSYREVRASRAGSTRRGLPSARWVRKEASVGVVSDLAGSALIIKWTVDKVKPRR